MSRSLPSRVVGLAAAAALVAAVGTPLLSAGADAAPIVKFTSNPSGSSLKVSTTKLKTGAVKVSMLSPVSDNGPAIDIVSLKPGYTLKDYKMFFKAATGGVHNPKQALKLINEGYKNTYFAGGFGSAPGHPTIGTVVLPKAGTYYAIANTGSGFGKIVTLHVTGATKHVAAPKSPTLLEAVTNMRWGGPATIPGTGTLVFHNKAKDYPHFVAMLPVKAGTTKDQVLAGLQSDSQGPPAFFDLTRADSGFSSSPVAPGSWLSAKVSLAPGAYAVMCFMPDKKTGMPHAFMGMIKIINVT